MLTRLLLFAGLSLCLCALACIGCSPSTQPTASNQSNSHSGKLRIAVIPKGTSHQFWMAVHAGAEAAAKEIGDVEILWKGPETEADTAGQIAVVTNFITSRNVCRQVIESFNPEPQATARP